MTAQISINTFASRWFCTGTRGKNAKVYWKAKYQSTTLQQAVSEQMHKFNLCRFLLVGFTNTVQNPDVCGPIISAYNYFLIVQTDCNVPEFSIHCIYFHQIKEMGHDQNFRKILHKYRKIPPACRYSMFFHTYQIIPWLKISPSTFPLISNSEYDGWKKWYGCFH